MTAKTEKQQLERATGSAGGQEPSQPPGGDETTSGPQRSDADMERRALLALLGGAGVASLAACGGQTPGGAVEARGFAVTTDKASYDAVRAMSPPGSGAVQFVHLQGREQAGDGGQGLFVWHSTSTDDDNDGTILKPASNPTSGRWLRAHDGAISARWFGAKADGSDDQPAIQAALDFAAGYNGTVLLPRGQYGLGAPLKLRALGVSLVGEGREATILRPHPDYTSNGYLIKANDNGSGWRGVLSGLTLDGKGIAANGILLGNTSDAEGAIKAVNGRLSDIWLTGFAVSNFPLYIIAASEASFERVEASYNSGFGILVGDAFPSAANTFDACDFFGNGRSGVAIQALFASTFRRCRFEENEWQGLLIHSPRASSASTFRLVKQVVFDSCYFEDNQKQVPSTSPRTSGQVRVTSNWGFCDVTLRDCYFTYGEARGDQTGVDTHIVADSNQKVHVINAYKAEGAAKLIAYDGAAKVLSPGRATRLLSPLDKHQPIDGSSTLATSYGDVFAVTSVPAAPQETVRVNRLGASNHTADGDQIVLCAMDDNTTLVHRANGGSINLLGGDDYTLRQGETIGFRYDGGQWFETFRSATTVPSLRITSGDLEVEDSSRGLVLSDGSAKWRVTIDTSGNLITTKL